MSFEFADSTEAGKEGPEPVWDIVKTRELVHARFGTEQLRAMGPSLNAAVARGVFAQLHYQRARERFETRLAAEPMSAEGAQTDANEAEAQLEKAFFLRADDDWNRFVLETEAELVACANSIRAALEGLVHAIYFATGMDLLSGRDRLDVNRVSPEQVLNRLLSKIPGAIALAHPLAVLIGDPVWHCLRTVDNLAKHRGYARASFSLMHSATDGWPRMLLTDHPAGVDWPDDVDDLWGLLRQAHDRVSRCVVASGIELNHWLETQQPGGSAGSAGKIIP